MVSLTKRQEIKLKVAELKVLRFSLGVTRMDRIRNKHMRETAKVWQFEENIRESGLRIYWTILGQGSESQAAFDNAQWVEYVNLHEYWIMYYTSTHVWISKCDKCYNVLCDVTRRYMNASPFIIFDSICESTSSIWRRFIRNQCFCLDISLRLTLLSPNLHILITRVMFTYFLAKRVSCHCFSIWKTCHS